VTTTPLTVTVPLAGMVIVNARLLLLVALRCVAAEV